MLAECVLLFVVHGAEYFKASLARISTDPNWSVLSKTMDKSSESDKPQNNILHVSRSTNCTTSVLYKLCVGELAVCWRYNQRSKFGASTKIYAEECPLCSFFVQDLESGRKRWPVDLFKPETLHGSPHHDGLIGTGPNLAFESKCSLERVLKACYVIHCFTHLTLELSSNLNWFPTSEAWTPIEDNPTQLI